MELIMKAYLMINFRLAVLIAIAGAAFILLVGEPTVYGQNWLIPFAAIKLSGCILALVCYLLYKHWSEAGLINKIGEVEEDEQFD